MSEVDKTREAGTEPADERERIQGDIEQTREELAESVEALAAKADVKAQAKKRIDVRKDAMREQGRRAQEKISGVRSQVSGATPEDAKAAAHKATTAAQERPLPVIGIAFAAGLALGRLTKRG
jgi:ElaB/YqjD/DUF883 family membrane-anchored ribosome-binding protein